MKKYKTIVSATETFRLQNYETRTDANQRQNMHEMYAPLQKRIRSQYTINTISNTFLYNNK